MNITYVWDGDYPWDIRADKVCTTLVEAGHQVHIACRNRGRSPLRETYHGAVIHRMPTLPLWMGGLNSILSFPAFFSPLWISHINEVAQATDCDLIIVRDLPLALTAIRTAKRLGVPCVLDMAECYPEMLRAAWAFGERSISNRFLRNPALADVVERAVFRRVDQVWVMIEESYDRLIGKGMPEERIRLISNTPVISRFTPRTHHTGEALQVIYVGLLNPSRGLDVAIRAVARFVQTDPGLHLRLVGSGKVEVSLRKLVNDLDVTNHVEFLGWVDNDEVPDLLSQADVGIVPHRKCTHWDTTIPNKLFDYMAAGIPVMVSSVRPMQRIVVESDCGVVYDEADLDTALLALRRLQDAKFRQRLGANGVKAVRERFNWAAEEEKLLRAVEELG